MAKKEDKKEEKQEFPPEFEKLPKEVKEKLKAIQKKVELFQKKVLKEFDKYILGIALLPPKNIDLEKKKAAEENKTLSKEDEEKLKDMINIFVLVDDSDSKKMSKEELSEKLNKIITNIAHDIDKNLNPEINLISEIKTSCEDGKYDVLQEIAQSQPVYDPNDVLAAFKISEVHKRMVLEKFEKYIVAYVAAGSLFRGEKSNDIDVYIVIDDTDVKRMSRAELKDKLRAIIYNMGFDASRITGVKKQFHIQTYILTDFWESIKDAHPVIYTLLRDGVPLFDRGVFMPWKQLLQMGRIRPSKEAIDMFMSSGERVVDIIKDKLKDIVTSELYYSMLNPSQAAVMMYGLAPPTPKETVQIMDEIFVKKEKMLEKKYVDMLEKSRKYFKDIEHGNIKEVKGKEIDELVTDAQDYLKRIQKLFEQIEAKRQKQSIKETQENIITLVRDALLLEGVKEVPETEIVEMFRKHLVNKGSVPERYTRILKELLSSKNLQEMSKTDIEKNSKESREFIRFMFEYIQRRRGQEIERAKIRVKYGDKFGEVLLLDDTAFITYDLDAKEREVEKAHINSDGSLGEVEKSSMEELNDSAAKAKIPKKAFIKDSIFDNLKEIFGSNVEVLVNY